MGFGKGSGSSAPVVTQEQKDLLKKQTEFLANTAYPAYANTIGTASNVYNQVQPAATAAAQTAMDVAARSGQLQETAGRGALNAGITGQGDIAAYQMRAGHGLFEGGAGQLGALFSPQYKQEQIQASLQPAREEIREQMGQQSALYGGTGGLGSARQALASRNLASLGEQRLGSVAAQTSAGVEGQRQRAAESLMGAGASSLGQAGSLFGSLASAGQQNLTGAQQAAANRIVYAGAPQDVLSKYASVIYGTPQASTTPNFSGTQGQRTTSKGFGF